jgi:hypothetical protein
MLKKKYIVQVYDEDGNACKMPRYFEGTEEEVKQYIKDRFEMVDLLCGRTTKYYETKYEDFIDDVPQKIDLDKVVE